MTNTDKRRYRDLLVTKSLTFKSSIKEKERLFSKVPKVMYKYSKANENTLENIKEQQIFLAPIEVLDDPFEFMISQNIDLIYDEKTGLFTEYFVDELAKKIQSKFQLCTVKQIKQIVQNVNNSQSLSSAKILAIATSDKAKHISGKQKKKDEIVKFLQRLSLMFAPKSPLFNAVTSFCKAKEIFGLGCLSEVKNNKVLWSLYSDVYKGVCLEYEIPNDSKFLDIFYPVIYSDESCNDIIEHVQNFVLRNIERAIKAKEVPGISSIYDIVCSKSKDWRFQKERRIVGDKNKTLPLKIKKIYLGYKISTSYERNIVAIAKKCGFSVYKMEQPSGDKKIKYKRLVKCHRN